jgi:15-cis-phytoene synthase
MPGPLFGSLPAVRGAAPVAGTINGADLGDSGSSQNGRSTLAKSFEWCRHLTRSSRSSFYLSFLTLPRNLFHDLCALYAFMRVSDDLGDDSAVPVWQRIASLEKWRSQLVQALDGGLCEHPVLPALADVVRRHEIPREYLVEVIDGVESDLTPRRFETFAELSDYCYHVAGAVGLCCVHIWGFSDPRAKDLAIDCGLAFQLTNILRDVAEDARVGRVYLPQEDLTRFGLRTEDLCSDKPFPRFRDLMAYEAARARTYFVRAKDLIPLCNPPARPILDAMMRTYAALLNAIEASAFDVQNRRIRVGFCGKMRITLGSLWRYRRAGEGAGG